MRTCLSILAICLLTACETTSEPGRTTADYDVQYGRDSDLGKMVIRSVSMEDVQDSRAYSNMTRERLLMWVEAVESDTGDVDVFIAGQRIRHMTEEDTTASGRTGRIDITTPVWIGRPLREADLQLRWRDVQCRGEAYYCNRHDYLEIALTSEMVEEFLASTRNDIPVALTRRTNIDWRIPKAELEAVMLKVAEVTAEGS